MINPKEDLSHIELPHSGNISSLNAVKAYRVNEVGISTKNKSKNKRFSSFYSRFFVLYNTACKILRYKLFIAYA